MRALKGEVPEVEDAPGAETAPTGDEARSRVLDVEGRLIRPREGAAGQRLSATHSACDVEVRRGVSVNHGEEGATARRPDDGQWRGVRAVAEQRAQRRAPLKAKGEPGPVHI